MSDENDLLAMFSALDDDNSTVRESSSCHIYLIVMGGQMSLVDQAL